MALKKISKAGDFIAYLQTARSYKRYITKKYDGVSIGGSCLLNVDGGLQIGFVSLSTTLEGTAAHSQDRWSGELLDFTAYSTINVDGVSYYFLCGGGFGYRDDNMALNEIDIDLTNEETNESKIRKILSVISLNSDTISIPVKWKELSTSFDITVN